MLVLLSGYLESVEVDREVFRSLTKLFTAQGRTAHRLPLKGRPGYHQ